MSRRPFGKPLCGAFAPPDYAARKIVARRYDSKLHIVFVYGGDIYAALTDSATAALCAEANDANTIIMVRTVAGEDVVAGAVAEWQAEHRP